MDRARRNLMRAYGDSWTYASEFFSGVVVWGAIGFGLDRWLGTWPLIFVIGVLIGHVMGVYLVMLRSRQATESAKRELNR